MAETPIRVQPERIGLQRRRIGRNVLSNWAAFVFSSIVIFFLSPFVVRHLGNSAYGIWVLIASLTGYMGLMDLGVRGAVTRYIAKFYAESLPEEASRVVSSALLIFAVAGALAISGSGILALTVVRLFHIPQEYQTTVRLILLVGGLNVAVSLISGVFGGVLVGLQRFDLTNLIEVLVTALRALAIVFALANGNGLVALAFIHLIFSMATGLISASLAFELYPGLRVRFKNCDRTHLRLIFSFGAYSFLLQLSWRLILYSDSVVIGVFLPVSAVTFFAIAGNLANYSRDLISGISTTASPAASSLQAQGNETALKKLVLHACRYATVVFLPIGLTFMLRGKTFIGLWMGPEYAERSGGVLWILALAMLFGAGNQVASATMVGLAKHKALVPVAIAEALLNIGLSIALIRPMGILGVAWGTTVPNLVTGLLFWPWYVRHTVGIPIWSYVLSTWVRPGVAAVPFALLTFAVERLWPAPNLPLFFTQIVMVMPVALLAAWYLCIPNVDRENYARKLESALARAFRRS